MSSPNKREKLVGAGRQRGLGEPRGRREEEEEAECGDLCEMLSWRLCLYVKTDTSSFLLVV